MLESLSLKCAQYLHGVSRIMKIWFHTCAAKSTLILENEFKHTCSNLTLGTSDSPGVLVFAPAFCLYKSTMNCQLMSPPRHCNTNETFMSHTSLEPGTHLHLLSLIDCILTTNFLTYPQVTVSTCKTVSNRFEKVGRV